MASFHPGSDCFFSNIQNFLRSLNKIKLFSSRVSLLFLRSVTTDLAWFFVLFCFAILISPIATVNGFFCHLIFFSVVSIRILFIAKDRKHNLN